MKPLAWAVIRWTEPFPKGSLYTTIKLYPGTLPVFKRTYRIIETHTTGRIAQTRANQLNITPC